MNWRVVMIAVFFVVINIWHEWAVEDPVPRRPVPQVPTQQGDIGDIERPLPDSSIFDPEVAVGLGRKQDSTGTAFAVGGNGLWMTARHVVDQCSRIRLSFPGRRSVVVRRVLQHISADLALLLTGGEAVSLALVDSRLHVGQNGFQVGYPGGRPGEVWSTLLGRRRMRVQGRYRTNEPVVAWAERNRRPPGLSSLGGLSGGPALDGGGRVAGVLVAESRRRGRIYTAAPASMKQLLIESAPTRQGGLFLPITPQTLRSRAEVLRGAPSVAKVLCLVT